MIDVRVVFPVNATCAANIEDSVQSDQVFARTNNLKSFSILQPCIRERSAAKVLIGVVHVMPASL